MGRAQKKNPEPEISPQEWYRLFFKDGRNDAAGSFEDVFDDAFDLDDLCKQYRKSADPESVRELAKKAYDAEYEVMEREGLREEWEAQNESALHDLEKDGGDPDEAFKYYQRGYREVAIDLLVDDILEHYEDMDEEEEGEDADD